MFERLFIAMTNFVILGTDTDAGKTTFALLWMSRFSETCEYWKPYESGASDTLSIQERVPQAVCHPPLCRFVAAVAPPLAARSEGEPIPPSEEIVRQVPRPSGEARSLVIETFGSPFSPLNETELQITLVQQYDLPTVLVSSSVLGAIGRTLQCAEALQKYGVVPAAMILMGPRDAYAQEQIQLHFPNAKVVHLCPPETWDADGIACSAKDQGDVLDEIRRCLEGVSRSNLSKSETQRLLADDKTHVWHPFTSLHDPDEPIPVVSAKDEFLHLADGRKVIDGFSSWWTILYGHRTPFLMASLAEAGNRFDHVHFAGVTHEPAVQLAKLLLSTMPWSGGKVFYSDNGSTAVEVALKMAYQYWCHQGEAQRTLFVGFENSYHGDTFGAMAASRDPLFFGHFEPLLFETKICPVCPERLDSLLVEHKGRVAGVIIEPLVQGAGGMQMHTPRRLGDLFEVARKHDVLFIADEVMVGGGRLGPLWAHKLAGITPDLICASKTLTGGIMPLAATLVAPHLVEAWRTDDRSKTFFHGHSFTGHPLACSVAVTNWQRLTTEENSRPQEIESLWRERLTSLQEHPRVREVRIRGSIAAIDLDLPGGYLAEAARQIRHFCLNNGAVLRPLGNVLYTMPPLWTSMESLELIAETMLGAVKALDS